MKRQSILTNKAIIFTTILLIIPKSVLVVANPTSATLRSPTQRVPTTETASASTSTIKPNRLLAKSSITDAYVDNYKVDTQNESPNNKKNPSFRIMSGSIIWILGLVGGILPTCRHWIVQYSNVRSYLNLFVGGIFLASSILHLLPDAVHNVQLSQFGCSSDDDADDDDCDIGELWAFFFFGIGFLLILGVELLAHTLQQQQLQHNHTNRFTTNQDDEDEEEEEEHVPINSSSNSINQEQDDLNNDRHCDSGRRRGRNINGHMVAFMVFVSLSFHSVMEGLAIGSQVTPPWDIFLAVIAHKSLASFALGLELHGKATTTKVVYSILFFTLMTPLVIYIGYLSISSQKKHNDEDDDEDSISSGICTALAAGIFIFVSVRKLYHKNFNAIIPIK